MSALNNEERRKLNVFLKACPFVDVVQRAWKDDVEELEKKLATAKGRLALTNRELKRRKRKEASA